MKGKKTVIIQNNRLHYKIDIKRNITVIQGDSATGKTTLINMIRQAENLGTSSGVDVSCEVPCRVLEGINWKIILENSPACIFFIDEENAFIKTEEFASAVKNSASYFVLITRENLYNLPYSVEEIYGLHISGKYRDTRKIYQEIYRIYPETSRLPSVPEKIITEDSNSGYQFFRAICAQKQIVCESAEYFSWERFFTKLLMEKTEGTYLQYKKASLNPAYLHEKNRNKILQKIKGIQL